jgi:hypothetical protein
LYHNIKSCDFRLQNTFHLYLQHNGDDTPQTFFWCSFHPQTRNGRVSHLCTLIEPRSMSMTTSLRWWRIISGYCDAEVGTAVPRGLDLFYVGRGRRMTHPAGVLTDRPLPCRRRLLPLPCNDAQMVPLTTYCELLYLVTL